MVGKLLHRVSRIIIAPSSSLFHLVKETNFVIKRLRIPLPLLSFLFFRRRKEERVWKWSVIEWRRKEEEEEEEDNRVAAGCRYNVYLQSGANASTQGPGRISACKSRGEGWEEVHSRLAR